MEFYDAIIVGGGPAGSSAAIQLAQSGASVLLAEQERFPREKLCGEFVSPECLEHFARLDVLEPVRNASDAALRETTFYVRSGRSVTVPSQWFGDAGLVALGLSRAEMDARLLSRARAAGAEVVEEATVSDVLIDGASVRGVRLSTRSEGTREIRAHVTIDATGRHRALARRIERRSNKLRGRAQLVAFKTHLAETREADGACEIYFYPGGYGGLNAVEGGVSNLCFIIRTGDVRGQGNDPARLMREVVMKNRRAARTLASAVVKSRWLGVALESFGRHELVPAEGLLAIGDAASFIDPFTGSGILMALESGEIAAQTVGRRLDRAREGRIDFASLAAEYRTLYSRRFDSRLRVCSLLRRAAFAPQWLTEIAAGVLNSSDHMRRRLARATRRSDTLDSAIEPRERLI